MQAIRSDVEKLLRHGGRPHMGPGSLAGTTWGSARTVSRALLPKNRNVDQYADPDVGELIKPQALPRRPMIE
jgi:hypothetical protein